MRHKITARTESILRELDATTRQIDAGLLSVASLEARREWRTLLQARPSEAELATGSLSLSDDELELMVAKVRRFKAILATPGRPRVRRVTASPGVSMVA
jgi:hypothetical protein